MKLCYRAMLVRLLGLFLVLYIPLSWSEPEKHIQWFQYDLPPYHILRGEYAGKGPLDHMFRLWQQALPEYQHTTTSVNTTRMLREFTSDQNNRCITGSFIFPMSIKNWLWSTPIYVEPPVVIVTRIDVWNQLNKPESIDFDLLLNDSSLTFGHFDGRIYSGEIDQTIRKIIDQKNVVTIASHASGESLMKMLQRKRVDYILEYLPEIHWLELSKQLEYTDEFITIKLNNHKSLLSVHVGCVKTEWGRNIIKRLNQVITINSQQEIWQHYNQWLVKPAQKEYFNSIQKNYFNELIDEVQ